MSVAQTIREKLEQGLSPTEMTIVDDSGRHAGHAGAKPEGETHFNVEIVSAAFDGLSRVQRQRLVYELLRAELAERVHALSLVTKTPAEAGRA